MNSLTLAVTAALLSGGAALAQTATTTPAPTAHPAPGMSLPASPNSSTRSNSTMSNQGASNPATPTRSTSSNSSDAAAASGDSNQAVATTDANAPVPAHGANSFTQGQAKTRLEKSGFSNVSGLSKDKDGVWHGTAQHDGHPVQVWLDYKGNVGQQG